MLVYWKRIQIMMCFSYNSNNQMNQLVITNDKAADILYSLPFFLNKAGKYRSRYDERYEKGRTDYPETEE
jgi:hypothetical protein